jgi:hypothetical protein
MPTATSEDPTTSGSDRSGAAPAEEEQDRTSSHLAGWRRVLVGLLLGFLAGALLALLLPRQRRPEDEPAHEPEMPAAPATREPDDATDR